MKLRIWFFVIIFLLTVIFGNLVWAGDYLLGPGDLLDISVWGYEELQVRELIVRPDGKIAFPLVGEVLAEGLTPAALTEQLTTALSDYVKNPMVTVNVVSPRTVRVYVLGEVSSPGMYEISKSHNLLDAIGAAGGYTKYANKSNVYVVHKATGQYRKANLGKILKKADLSQNYELGEGDIVYLTPNGLSFINDILPYLSALYQLKVVAEQ